MEKRKMNVKKILVIFVMVVVLMMVIQNYVYSSSFVFEVKASKTKLKPGEETTVTMKILDIVDVNELGVNALESVLEYDSNVLEIVTVNDMKGKNNWTITYNQEEGNFLVHNLVSGIKEEQEIGEIKFKVKDNVAKKTKTIIKFKNVKSNDGGNLMHEADKQVELLIDWDEKNDPIVKIENLEEKQNVAIGTIPQTGEEAGIVVVISIIAILGLVLYVKSKRMEIK